MLKRRQTGKQPEVPAAAAREEPAHLCSVMAPAGQSSHRAKVSTAVLGAPTPEPAPSPGSVQPCPCEQPQPVPEGRLPHSSLCRTLCRLCQPRHHRGTGQVPSTRPPLASPRFSGCPACVGVPCPAPWPWHRQVSSSRDAHPAAPASGCTNPQHPAQGRGAQQAGSASGHCQTPGMEAPSPRSHSAAREHTTALTSCLTLPLFSAQALKFKASASST